MKRFYDLEGKKFVNQANPYMIKTMSDNKKFEEVRVEERGYQKENYSDKYSFTEKFLESKSVEEPFYNVYEVNEEYPRFAAIGIPIVGTSHYRKCMVVAFNSNGIPEITFSNLDDDEKHKLFDALDQELNEDNNQTFIDMEGRIDELSSEVDRLQEEADSQDYDDSQEGEWGNW